MFSSSHVDLEFSRTDGNTKMERNWREKKIKKGDDIEARRKKKRSDTANEGLQTNAFDDGDTQLQQPYFLSARRQR